MAIMVYDGGYEDCAKTDGEKKFEDLKDRLRNSELGEIRKENWDKIGNKPTRSADEEKKEICDFLGIKIRKASNWDAARRQLLPLSKLSFDLLYYVSHFNRQEYLSREGIEWVTQLSRDHADNCKSDTERFLSWVATEAIVLWEIGRAVGDQDI